MTLRSSDLQSDGDLDSIRNSCGVFVHIDIDGDVVDDDWLRGGLCPIFKHFFQL